MVNDDGEIIIHKNMMKFKAILKEAKLRLLRMHYESQIGHIGGNLSAIDAMLYLHHCIIERGDYFVLSKGHAAGALYVTLWSTGKITEKELLTFHQDGTRLAGHPIPNFLPDIPVATGSLGHGLPVSVGMALAEKIKKMDARIFCLMSDGEWEEGSNWEALIFSVHNNLNNLIILIDVNGLQGFGTTREVASLEPLFDKIESFGVAVHEINGHKPEEMATFINRSTANPKCILLRTVKGHGISFMENRMEWHYLPLNDKQYFEAIREVSFNGEL